MRKKFLSIEKPIKFWAIWVILYAIILFIGISVTLAATYINNTHMQQIAYYDCQYYLTNGTFNPNVAVNGAHNLIYDKDLNLVEKFPHVDTFDFTDRQLQKYYDKTLETASFYSLRCNLFADHKIAIFTVYPLNNGGLFLFYREPPFVKKTLIILTVMATVLVWMMAIFVYVLMKMSYKTQKIQRDYIDNITHELKSPIASVKALTETMYDGLIHEEEKRKRYYKIILNEMSGLESTVSNMLELSKIQHGQIDATKTYVSSYDLFDSVLEKYAALCDERNMELSISPDRNTGCTLYTNQNLISRILEILLDNAVKFADREHGCIKIIFDENAKEVIVSVLDNGSGITPEDQKLIFSRFYKGDKSHNEKGSGLGLSIAQEIARCLNEKLWLKSSGPDGTAFCFTIQKQTS